VASPFDDLDAAASAVTAALYGEAALLRARSRALYATPGPDTSRGEIEVFGVFSKSTGSGPIKGQATGAEFGGTTRLNMASAEFWLAAEQVAMMVHRPAKGDELVLHERPGQPAYAITAVHESNMGDVALTLVREDP
jgi:hypothetical protein